MGSDHGLSTPDDIGSGAQALIGYEIDLGDPDGAPRIHLEIAARHLNRNQTLHGGIIAMLLDAAAGFAASCCVPDAPFSHVLTLNLSTNFVGAVSTGRVTATGQYRGGGRKIAYADAVLADADGGVLATASGVFKRRAPG
ncbi:MAG: PaaI family thioesterase [Marinibacterium sp.]|nr:PaaI family thioesterase [Marinibacterium sp.]